ncbi:MAG: hypothetical protein JNL74_07315, partial [Fibrobacteres bacterium]|nr:hypothetical protein [Fibrobacterota bacterium]
LNTKRSSEQLTNLMLKLGDTAFAYDGDPEAVFTGAQLYSRIAKTVGAKADTILTAQGRIPFPADYYAVALGTLELSLYEQMHLFNVFYNNEIIVKPEERTSLVIRSIEVSGIPLTFNDNVEKRSLFADMNNIRPVQYALHQRLVSTAADGLSTYDIPIDSTFDQDANPTLPLSNFAKSGTSDDIIRPYNKDIVTGARTNYCLWNAVLRLNLPQQQNETTDSLTTTPLTDVTLSCIGEGNEKNTGSRDGKSMHKYLSAALLKTYGVPVDSGYFKSYMSRF